MPVTVKLKYLRISPRKVRLVADLIRGKTVKEAETTLEFVRKRAAKPLKKLLKSGVATAENDFQMEKSNLYISEIRVDEGPTLKRYRFRGFGRIYPILKRTSHITLSLDEIKPSLKSKKKKGLKEKEKEKPKPREKVEVSKTPKPKPKIKLPRPKFAKVAKKFFRRKAF